MNTNQISRNAKLTAVMFAALIGFSGYQVSASYASDGKKIPSNLKINMERAIAIANETARDGKVSEIELEHEDGKWVYEAELKMPQGGEKEILIDAMTGQVLKVEIENEKEEGENKEKDDD